MRMRSSGFACRMATFWSSEPMSSERMFDLSRSKWIIAARVVRTSSDERASAARESALRCCSTRSRSAAAWRSRSACAAASESARARAAAAAESALGVTGCGAGLPPQDAAANTAAPKPSARSNDTDFILSLRSGGGRSSLRKPWRPSRQTRPALLQQWPDSAGVEIDDPQLAVARPVGYKGEMTAVGSPGRILVTPRSEEHTSELQSRLHLVCRLLLEKKKNK